MVKHLHVRTLWNHEWFPVQPWAYEVGEGGGGLEYVKQPFSGKKKSCHIRANHLIFGQAMDKNIRATETKVVPYAYVYNGMFINAWMNRPSIHVCCLICSMFLSFTFKEEYNEKDMIVNESVTEGLIGKFLSNLLLIYTAAQNNRCIIISDYINMNR